MRALLVLACLACSSPAAGPPVPFAGGPSPAYDAVWQVATHNSYWVDRGVSDDVFSGGVGERLLDQMLVDHVRALEIDVHRDDDVPHAFRVFHTAPGNTLCTTLPECLGILRAFHRTVPDHEAVLIIVELKELFREFFDEEHTALDLDAVFAEELGPLLYRPADVLAACAGHPGYSTLGACVGAVGWESIARLRGRFLVAILGNWDQLGGQATADWALYATHGELAARAAFPMASSWELDWAALGPNAQAAISPEELEAAVAEAAFLQIEDPDDAMAPMVLARRGIVRVDNVFSDEQQAGAIARSLQLLQTDVPSLQHDDRGPAQPFRAFDGRVAQAETSEPGDRLALAGAQVGERVFAHTTGSAGRWETTLSFGADATRTGCLRAAAGLGQGGETSASLCAHKLSAAGTPDAERLFVDLVVCRQGDCATTGVASADNTPGGPGELLALELAPDGCVTASAARLAGRDLTPLWSPVGQPACFDEPLPYQGLARLPGGSDAPLCFFATTRAGAAVRAADLTVISEPAAGAPRAEPTLLDDLSTP